MKTSETSTPKKSEFFKYDRHDLFTMEDLDTVREIRNRVPDFSALENMAYGLYDGYLYLELMEWVGENVPEDTHAGRRIADLFHRIMNVAELNTF